MTDLPIEIQRPQAATYRLVGSYEYYNALTVLNCLVAHSSRQDLEAYDKVLAERPEFSFFHGMNLVGKQVRMKDLPDVDRRDAEKQFKKFGLAWMMALAKVEISATESLYGRSRMPFQSQPPTHFDFDPYVRILADDAAAHLLALNADDMFKKVTQPSRKVDRWTLSYLRRLKLIRDMLVTLEEAGTNVIRRRIKEYDKGLAKYERQLMNAVDSQTGFKSSIGTSTKSNTQTHSFYVLSRYPRTISTAAKSKSIRLAPNQKMAGKATKVVPQDSLSELRIRF